LIYYPVQGLKKVNNFPFASANWDTGHLSGYAFPEVAMNGKFEYREKWYANEIYKAIMVFAESESGKEELLKYTKLNPDRIGIVPLFPAEVVNLKVSNDEQENYLSKYKLKPKHFFFYPAQFWAHKNHYNLLLAFQKYSALNPEVKLVLSGSDKGNKKYIEESAKKMGLESKVLFAGFIDIECLYTFYKHALAMIFPGILGPTNMPLLEARMLDCPVICSDIKGHREIMNDGALYFNPLNGDEIFNCMKTVTVDQEREMLLSKAKKSLQGNIFTTEMALKALDENFLKLKSIRQTWGKSERIF
jgi:glycosyltransferase involved in cell wall biosynthesis